MTLYRENVKYWWNALIENVFNDTLFKASKFEEDKQNFAVIHNNNLWIYIADMWAEQ